MHWNKREHEFGGKTHKLLLIPVIYLSLVECSCINISYLDSHTILAHFEQHAMIECLREMKKKIFGTEYCYSCCNTTLN